MQGNKSTDFSEVTSNSTQHSTVEKSNESKIFNSIRRLTFSPLPAPILDACCINSFEVLPDFFSVVVTRNRRALEDPIRFTLGSTIFILYIINSYYQLKNILKKPEFFFAFFSFFVQKDSEIENFGFYRIVQPQFQKSLRKFQNAEVSLRKLYCYYIVYDYNN